MEVKEYTILDINPTFAEGIAKLSKSFAEEIDWGQYTPIGKMHPAEKFLEFYYSQKYVMGKVALVKDELVAFVWVTEYPKTDNSGTYWEASLLISKPWRKSGVSRDIMYALREDIPEEKEIEMWVSEKNVASIKHCQAMGYEFRLREIVKDYHPVFDGEWAQLFTWRGVKKAEKPS